MSFARVSACIFSSILVWLLIENVQGSALVGEVVTFTVSTPAEATELAEAMNCTESSTFIVDWQGRVELVKTLILGNGSSLNVSGSEGAVIDGRGLIPLLKVSGGVVLSLDNITLENARGGAISTTESSIVLRDCILSSNIAEGGGEFNGHSECTNNEIGYFILALEVPKAEDELSIKFCDLLP